MRSLLALSLTLLAATVASAAPGDPRVIQGRLVWPPVLGEEKFMIVVGNDGTSYFADLATAHNLARSPMKAGDEITFAGLEGQRPHEVDVAAVGPDNAITITASRAALPAVVARAQTAPEGAAATAAISSVLAGDWQRLDGTIDRIAGMTMELRTRDGQRVSIDVSRLNHPHWLKPGQEISVYAQPHPEGALAAVGFIQRQPLGSALPRAVR